MSILKNIFRKDNTKQKVEINSSEFSKLNKDEFNNFIELLEQNAGLSFEKQLIFGKVIGSKPWELDMATGLIVFENLEFPIQIIGSLSFNDNSWMWGWANEKSGIPENLLKQSSKLKIIGSQKNIKELSEAHFIVEEGFEHKIGIIACGLFNSKSYYCANYGQGTLVVTIDDNKIPEINKEKFENILTNFPQLISSIELNHKNTFKNYLIDRDFDLKIEKNNIKGLKNNTIITAEFDDLHRLKSLNGTIK